MDRSFLSQTNVIDASRAFVCVRLATYEDNDESNFLKNFTHTASGELENSVFGIVAPDGKQKLVRSGRGPNHSFRGPAEMAQTMQDIAKKYPGDPKKALATLPLVATLKLGVNVAAADNQALVAIIADDRDERKKLETILAPFAWNSDFIGRFIYASGSTKDASTINGLQTKAGIVVVSPEQFGRSGAVIAVWDKSQSLDELAKTLHSGITKFTTANKTFANHVREGQRQGVFWEPPVPVTDPMEQKARERGKKLNPPK